MSDSGVRRVAGFTLLEVIVAMALIAILSVVTVFSMAYYIPNLRLKSASQEINVQIRKARLESVRQSRRCYVDFFRTDNGVVYSPFIWVDMDADDVYDPGDIVLYKTPVSLVGGEWELTDFRGIRYDVAFGGGDGVTFPPVPPGPPVKGFRLNSRGLSTEAGSLNLRNARGRTTRVLMTLGGATRIQ